MGSVGVGATPSGENHLDTPRRRGDVGEDGGSGGSGEWVSSVTEVYLRRAFKASGIPEGGSGSQANTPSARAKEAQAVVGQRALPSSSSLGSGRSQGVLQGAAQQEGVPQEPALVQNVLQPPPGEQAGLGHPEMSLGLMEGGLAEGVHGVLNSTVAAVAVQPNDSGGSKAEEDSGYSGGEEDMSSKERLRKRLSGRGSAKRLG